MALLRYFQAKASLSTTEETGLGDTLTQSANAAIIREVQAKRPRKRKAYTAFTAEQRATIGKYASEHGNAAAVKKFKADFEGGQLGESTVRLFKKRYIEEFKKPKHSGATVPEVRSTAYRKRGRPLTLGDVDTKVQAYIKALRKAGTPVNVNIVLAAAEGVFTAVDRTLLKKNGGTIELKRPWTKSLMRRMKFVKRRGSTQANGHAVIPTPGLALPSIAKGEVFNHCTTWVLLKREGTLRPFVGHKHWSRLLCGFLSWQLVTLVGLKCIFRAELL